MTILIVAIIAAIVLFLSIINRYRRCPSDKILVIYGSRGTSRTSAKCIHGGGAFVWPIIQDYAYLSLTPISIDANLSNALSKQNIRVDVPSRFTVGISTDAEYMNAAAERLLGLTPQQIQELARDILFGQLRLVIAQMSIEELNNDRDKFLEAISANVENELKKIGLRLINVNVTDIKDESGYIEALGQEAAAKAINEAKVRVAEQEKLGEIGKADALREARVRTAEANARAVEGENKAKVEIAQSDANRREKEAEAQRTATAAERVQQALAQKEAYQAEKDAENARAERERSTKTADIIVAQEIEKTRKIIEAQAQAEQQRVNAKGQADAIFAKMEAQAKGYLEVLTKQAQGYDQIVQAAGGDPTKAYMLLLIEKLPELIKTQVEAVKGINIDHVTVWDSGNTAGGKTSTANFLSGLMSSIPPLSELFEKAGLNLPEYLAKKTTTDTTTQSTNNQQ